MIATQVAVPASEQNQHRIRHELRRAVPLLPVIPLMILAIWGIGVLVIHSRIDDWDLSADRWLAGHRVGWLNTATEWGTYLAETIPVIVILLTAIVVARRRTGNWRASVFMAVVVAGEKIVYFASSTLVARARPPLPTLDNTYATSSFPSGHVGSAVTLYAAIALAVGAWRGRTYLIALMGVMLLCVCIVAFSRMYRGFHYPSDCVAGALVGTIWTTLCVRVLRPIKQE
ncbi:MAG: phosphoesterase PA-phosphatase related [Ilumatobacteraceae bacterium]|nr:phosphoesterase PA-phosphatase related [Ilumatobacteraceae bacterium]